MAKEVLALFRQLVCGNVQDLQIFEQKVGVGEAALGEVEVDE